MSIPTTSGWITLAAGFGGLFRWAWSRVWQRVPCSRIYFECLQAERCVPRMPRKIGNRNCRTNCHCPPKAQSGQGRLKLTFARINRLSQVHCGLPFVFFWISRGDRGAPFTTEKTCSAACSLQWVKLPALNCPCLEISIWLVFRFICYGMIC